mgnify:CR=1 FL=1
MNDRFVTMEMLTELVEHRDELFNITHPKMSAYIEKELTVLDWINDAAIKMRDADVHIDETSETVALLADHGYIGDAENDHTLFDLLAEAADVLDDALNDAAKEAAMSRRFEER